MSKKKRFVIDTCDKLYNYANEVIEYELENPTSIFDNFIDEEHGIAAYPFINDIRKLYGELNDILESESEDDNIPEIIKTAEIARFKIPGMKPKKIPCIKHTIRIKFNDSDFSFKDYFDLPNSVFTFIVKNFIVDDPVVATFLVSDRGSYYIMSNDNYFDNNKMITAVPETILINTYAINGQIDIESFFRTFFHEFNHLSQDFNSFKKNKRRENDKAFIREVIMHHFNSKPKIFDDYDITCINDIIYCLCGDTEINAFIAELFAELISNNIDVNNINRFLNKSSVWGITEKMANALDHVMKFNDEQLWYLHDIFVESKYVKNLSTESKTIIEFKRRLYKDMNNRLQKLIDGMSKIIGFYCASVKNKDIS